MELTWSVWPSKGLTITLPVSVSHMQTVWSSEAKTICPPSEEKATDVTQPLCPSNVLLAYTSPVFAFHR